MPGKGLQAVVLPFEYGVPELLNGTYSGAALQALENVEPAGIYITEHAPWAHADPRKPGAA